MSQGFHNLIDFVGYPVAAALVAGGRGSIGVGQLMWAMHLLNSNREVDTEKFKRRKKKAQKVWERFLKERDALLKDMSDTVLLTEV